MHFEWNEKENKENMQRNGLSFSEALHVFSDPNLLIIPVPKESLGRWNAMGFIGNILFVVSTERGKNNIKIISARKATQEEFNEYKNYDFR